MKKLPLIPTFGKALKATLSEMYGSMAYMLLISVAWFASFIPQCTIIILFFRALFDPEFHSFLLQLLIFGSLICSVWTALVTGPVTSALYGMNREKKDSYIGWRTFVKYFKSKYWISFRAYFVITLGVTLAIFNVVISLMEPGLPFKIIGLISLYLLIVLGLMSFYFQPLIFYKHGFKSIFYRSFILSLDNLGLTFLFSLMVGLVFAFGVPSIIVVVLVFGAFYIYLTDFGFEAIAEKYEEEQTND